MKEYIKVIIILIIVLIGIAIVAEKTGFASNTIKKVTAEEPTQEFVVEDTERNGTHCIHVKGCKNIQGKVTSIGRCKNVGQAKSSARSYYGSVTVCAECTNKKFEK